MRRRLGLAWALCVLSLSVGACSSEDAGGDDMVVLPGAQGTDGQGIGAMGDPSADPTALPQAPGGAAGSGAPADTPQGDDGDSDPTAPGGDSRESCEGFPLEGLMYSPGGDVLPNTCEPFHPTLNNPYAVRCIDAWPWFETQFPGDEYCILPPEPGKGIQYGVHPQGKDWFAQVSTGDMSGYDDPQGPYLLASGGEEERNYLTGVEHAEARFYRNHARMRPGSHHMIVSSADGNQMQEVWGPGSPDGLFGGTSLPGAQRPDENTPKSLGKPDEDTGLYSVLPANTGVTFNMHHFNATSGPILKEAWTNLWWEDDATVRVQPIFGLELAQAIGLAVQPGQTRDLHYSWNISQPVRLISAFGHRHAWTTNFSSWVEKPGGDLEILYQSYDWFDEPTYRYDSITQNPPPAPEMRADGAASGVRMLNPGEKLHFNCHIEYTNERAAAEGAPMPSEIGTLRFANQAFTAEMCILFGSTAGVSLSRPSSDATALPDFATN